MRIENFGLLKVKKRGDMLERFSKRLDIFSYSSHPLIMDKVTNWNPTHPIEVKYDQWHLVYKITNNRRNPSGTEVVRTGDRRTVESGLEIISMSIF